MTHEHWVAALASVCVPLVWRRFLEVDEGTTEGAA
jgi:hypothetical protein